MGAPNVILYGHRGCPGSDAARAYFEEHAIPYRMRDVSRETAAMGELRALGGWATPLILVGRQVLMGFDPAEFVATLRREELNG